MMRTMLCAALVAAATAAPAAVTTETLEYQHDGVTLRSVIAYDTTGSGPRPGVIVVPEWWGVNDYAIRRAEDMARLGYVGLATDIYGEGKLVSTPEEAGKLASQFRGDRKLARARAGAALEALKARPEVDGTRIGAMGYCFGGMIVLEMARGGLDVKGVASFHGALGTGEGHEPGPIRARVLVLHGAEDPLVTDSEVAAFVEEMRAAKADWELVQYGNAVHTFTNPAADAVGMPGVAYNEWADRRSFDSARDFFLRVFDTFGQ